MRGGGVPFGEVGIGEEDGAPGSRDGQKRDGIVHQA